MPRKPLERSQFFPYHVYNRSLDKKFYPLNPQERWNELCNILTTTTWAFDGRVHAFVMMGNHYHLVLSTPSENLDDCIQYFQSEFSHWLSRQAESAIYGFATRYRWSMIRDPIHYGNVYRYVYQNPVRAGLVKRAEDYRFSTLHGRCGKAKLEVPIFPHEFSGVIPDLEDSELEWVNAGIVDKEVDRIRLGLRRFIFSPPARIRGGGKRSRAGGKSS